MGVNDDLMTLNEDLLLQNSFLKRSNKILRTVIRSLREDQRRLKSEADQYFLLICGDVEEPGSSGQHATPEPVQPVVHPVPDSADDKPQDPTTLR